MDLRQHALEGALIKNFEETKRWEAYKKEHLDVVKNLNEFQKKLEIEVMVPIGSKAYMPGVIYHTNEVLFSHFQGHFSKVTTHQALELVQHRLKMSDERLKNLELERTLYEQNLGIPMMEDAFAGGGDEQEIIEDYDEEVEKKWREDHRAKVKEMKKQEAEERMSTVKIDSDEDIFALLDEREMMEELESELESLNVEDDDQLEKLLSGEVKPPPEKKRVAHESTHSSTINERTSEEQTSSSRPRITTYTNNNHIANQQDFNPTSPAQSDSEEDESDSESDVPEEFKKMTEIAKNLSRIEKIHFYKEKLNGIKKNIRGTRINDEHDLMKRISEIEMKEVLEDTIDDLRLEEDEEEEGMDGEEEEEESEEQDNENDEEDEQSETDNKVEEKSNEKRRISFSNDIKVEYINSRDAPIQISINNNPGLAETVAASQAPVDFDEFPMHEPRLDYDSKNTVQIKFKHSDEVWTLPTLEKDLIGNPLDIYKKVKTKNQNKKVVKGNKGGKGKWKEKEKKGGPMEVAVTASTTEAKESVPVELKSILKNCNLVENEKHHEHTNNNPDDVDDATEEAITQRKKKIRETFVCEAPDFSTIMGEVTENVESEPDPLPPGEFVDAFQPKKRVSRFKSSRSKN